MDWEGASVVGEQDKSAALDCKYDGKGILTDVQQGMPLMMHKLKSVPKLRVFKTENRFISPEVVYYRPKSIK